ncbi:MAG: hypothetical protein AAF702_05570 [Chloroflexota bacterium]
MRAPRKEDTYQNGYHPAPSKSGGAFLSADQPFGSSPDQAANLHKPSVIPQSSQNQNRTVFPEDVPLASTRTFLYNLVQHSMMGWSLFRWGLSLIVLLVLIGLGVGLYSWRIAVILAPVLLLIPYSVLRRWRKEDYVHFEESSLPEAQAESLDSAEKIPVHVTGLFHVEGREQRFTWLPGFYRTFATREHALLCMAPDSTFLRIGGFDPDCVGMWYIFFEPKDICELRWGSLYFGRTSRPTILVTRQFVQPAKGRMRREKIATEQVFLSFQNEADGQRIWSDLIVDATHVPLNSPAQSDSQ